MTVVDGSPLTARRAVAVRVGLIVLALNQAIVGGWALHAPGGFFAGFPAPGRAWVALLGPYDEHLVRDVGALSLAVTVLLAAAAWWAEVRLVRVALVAFLVYAAPHDLFHILHLEGFGTADAVAQTTGLVLQLGLAIALVVLTLRPTTAPTRWSRP